MFQIDNSTAASSQPPSTPAGAAGFFTDGNPASNQPATIVPAEWLNSVMMELANAVTGSGQTLNKAAFNQLWTAMQTIAKNPGVTPPQFDNSTKTATTQFVQRALGNMAGAQVFTATGAINLTAAHMGLLLDLTATVTGPINLPPSASLVSGACVEIYNGTSGPMTLAANGSDMLWPTNGSMSSLSISAGDTVRATCIAGGSPGAWIVEGAGALNYSKQFAASIGSPGYQKLPSGLIVQWGYGVSSGGVLTQTLPIAFPLAQIGGVGNVYGAGVPNVIAIATLTQTQIGLYSYTSNTGAAVNSGISWLVWGH